MKKRDLLLIIAVIFLMLSPFMALYLVPSMKRLPKDLDKVIYYNGRLGMLSLDSLQLEYKDIEIVRHIKVIKDEGDVLIVREDIQAFDANTGEPVPEIKMVKIYGINPYTAENIEGYGDLDRMAHWIFPVGVEKKDYPIWNTDLDDACRKGYIKPEQAVAIGHYLGEEYRGGIKTYKFYGSQNDIFVGYLPDLPEAKLYYGGYIYAWVDPVTGTIVDLYKHLWQYAKFPDLHKLPSNLNKSVYLTGKLVILNQTNGKYENYNLTVCNKIRVIETNEKYYTIENKVIAKDENGREIKELEANSTDAVNPYTMEYIEKLSNKKGLMTFPIGVEKRDYLLWNGDINNVSVAEYKGEYDLAGLKTYVYVINVSDYYIGKQFIEGLSDRWIDLYFTGNTTFYVEPNTGFIVYLEKKGCVKAQFPDLHTLPENYGGKVEMEGELWIISQPKRNIEMEREVEVENVYWEDGKKILLMKDTTTTYDKATGEKIDMACITEYHGVYADSGMEAKNYGDMAREGLYIFAPGVERKDYIMWNPEIGTTSLAKFVREEDHYGIHTYLFEINEDRVVYDPTPGIEMVVRYITTTKYWVEPATGIIIDMQKESVKKINPLEALLGIRGFFWIDVYKMRLSFTQDTIQEMKKKAEELMDVVALSGKKVDVLKIDLETQDLEESLKEAIQTKKQIESLSGNKVKVVDLEYWMTEKSVKEMAEEAKKAGFLLIFMQFIIPAFLAFIGIVLIAVWVRR